MKKCERLAAIGKVAGLVAHKINNPLNAIMNAIYLLREQPSLYEEARGYARLADKELARVSHIVRQTPSFYRETESAVDVSVSDLLDEVLTLQARLEDTRKFSIEKCYGTKGYVHGLPVELK